MPERQGLRGRPKQPELARAVGELADRTAHPLWRPSCRLWRSSTQSVASLTEVAVSFDTEKWDNDNMHDGTNPTRITIRTAGIYSCWGAIEWPADATPVEGRGVAIVLNGATYLGWVWADWGWTTATITIMNNIYAEWEFAVGDYIELWAYHRSSGSQSLVSNDPYSSAFGATLLSTSGTIKKV